MEGAIVWIFWVGIAAWLTGKMFGEEGYGRVFGGLADLLDILTGAVGAAAAVFLFVSVAAPAREGWSIQVAILGAVLLVIVVRLASIKPCRRFQSGSPRR